MKVGVRELLFAVLLLGVPLAAWWFVFRPSNFYQEELRAEVEAKQDKLGKLTRLVGTVGDLKTEIASLERAITFFQSKLPSQKEIDKVLQETWRLAEDSSLATKSIRTAPQATGQTSLYTTGTQAEQIMLVHLEGSFEGLYAFMQALERQPRIMRISRMDISKLSEAEEGCVVAKLDMSVFFEKSEKD